MPKHKYAQSNEWGKWPKIDGYWYIYGLYLVGESEIRYVGSTVEPAHRFYEHMHEPMLSIKDWLAGNEEQLRITVLKVVDRDRLGEERKMIGTLLRDGHRLLNNNLPRVLTKEERVIALQRWMER
jgi:hypothetical protein